MNSHIWAATKMAEVVYKDFLEKVIQNHVINNRCTIEDQHGKELSEKEKKLIKEEKMFDPRVVRLMSISGKGGWHSDPEKQERYGRNDNVTLLDHLLSVTRGSLMLASLDWLSRNPEMDNELLKRKLYVIAALAFMHDIDKDLCISRITDVSTVSDAEVEERMTRYGINEFLETVGVKLAPDQLLYLIDKVESLQANRRLPKEMPPRYADGALPLYVRLADKLDGVWLSEEGIEGVLNRLKNDKSCIRSKFLCQLFDELDISSPVIDLFDPHHPFLMDELQRRLSKLTQDGTGAPPLIEIHHDGRLVMFMLANKSQLAQIKKRARQDLTESLAEGSFQLRLNVNTRGEPELLNRQPSHAQLHQFIFAHPHDKNFQKVFLIKRIHKELITEPLDDLLDEFGLNPIFPSSKVGQTITLYDSVKDMGTKAKERLKKAAHAILLLNILLKPNPISYDNREKTFLALIPEERPDWITAIEHGHSRRVLTALWAITIADNNEEVDKAIWGEQGLLQQWLESSPDQKGFNQFIKAEGDSTIQEIDNYFRQLFSGQRIEVENEAAEGRCLFTDQPVDYKKRLQDNMGLTKVGIKAGAFSGRDNRPEYLDASSSGHTNISPISMAEQQLRIRIHGNARNLDTPTLIYSPTTIGLFGGLAMNIDQDMQTLSLQELSEFYVKRSNMMGMEHYRERCRIMRFEHLPGKTAEQVDQLHRLLKANLRIGRPIHVFRGLPTANRAFFHYDAMPSLLAKLLSEGKFSGNSLRLEQIQPAIQRLEMAKLLLNTWGYGYNALQLYANPKTRFRGICFAWCGLHEKHRWIANRLLLEYESYFKQGELKMSVDITAEDGVMVQLGRMAAKIQRFPKKGFQASKSEQMMVLDNCLAVLSEGFRMPQSQTDRLSLINGIAERLEIMLDRRNLVAATEHRDGISFQDACIEVATFFVDEFWIDVMNQRFPSQDNLRFSKSVYRMSFMRRAKKTTENGETYE